MKIEKRLLSLIGVFLFISHLLMLPAFSADPLDAPYPNNPGGRLDFLKKGIDPASSDVIAAWRRVRNELGVYSPGGIIEDVRGLQNRTAVAERDLAALRATNPAAIAAQAARVPGLEARVLTLEADVVTLTGERNTLRVDLITRTRERDAFAADLRIRTTERDRLNLDIAAERATIVILQRDLADRIKERDDFEARLLASLTTLGLRDAEIVAHEAELEVRKNKIIGLEHDKLAVEAELSLKEAELVIITSERDQLKLDIATERATIITLRQDLATRTGERNQLNINIGTLQHDLVDTESKRADFEVKWVASQSALGAMTIERNRLNLDIAAERATIVTLRQGVVDRTRERDDFESDLRTRTTERDQLKLDRRTLQHDLATKETQRADFEAKWMTSQTALGAMTIERNRLNVDITAERAIIVTLRKNLADRIRERDGFEVGVRTRTDERDQLNLDIAAERATIRRLQKDLADHRKEKCEFESKLSKAQTASDLKDIELGVLRGKVRDFEHDMPAIATKLNDKEADLALLTTEKRHLNDRITVLERGLETAAEESRVRNAKQFGDKRIQTLESWNDAPMQSHYNLHLAGRSAAASTNDGSPSPRALDQTLGSGQRLPESISPQVNPVRLVFDDNGVPPAVEPHAASTVELTAAFEALTNDLLTKQVEIERLSRELESALAELKTKRSIGLAQKGEVQEFTPDVSDTGSSVGTGAAAASGVVSQKKLRGGAAVLARYKDGQPPTVSPTKIKASRVKQPCGIRVATSASAPAAKKSKKV